MRTSLGLLLMSVAVLSGEPLLAQQPATSTAMYVCPDCGKLHPVKESGRLVTSTPSTTGVQRTIVTPSSNGLAANKGGVTNVLGALNGQRARQGVGKLVYDPQLQVVAERRVRQMAASGLKNHPPGSIAPGRYEGVGWSSSYSPSGVSACFTSDSRMRYAGAAMATGRDGVYFAVVYR